MSLDSKFNDVTANGNQANAPPISSCHLCLLGTKVSTGEWGSYWEKTVRAFRELTKTDCQPLTQKPLAFLPGQRAGLHRPAYLAVG